MEWVLAALQLYRQLRLDAFWAERLSPSRKGTRWDLVLLILAVYRLLSPGSEWRLHREWYGRSALADLLDMDAVIDAHALYDCHDLLLEHKGRWSRLDFVRNAFPADWRASQLTAIVYLQM